MGYVVSALTNYTAEDANKVIYNKLFTGSPILDAIKNNSNLMTGVKSAETINIVSTEGVWQAQACTVNPSGSSTFSQRTVTVGKIKVDISFCESALEPKFLQKKMAKGSTYDALTYVNEITEDINQQIQNRMRTAIWQGDTASVDQYLKHFNGLNKTLIADVAAGNIASGTAWSTANSRTVMQALAAKVVADTTVYHGGTSTAKAYMSPAMAFAYRQKLITDNLYHLNAFGENQQLFIEGTTIPIVEDAGLAGLNYIWVIEDENLYGGTDMENEEEKYNMWYSKDQDLIYFNARWKFGVNVAFPTRVYGYLGV